MTDPRIEAAARALGEYVYERNGKPLKWDDMGDIRQEAARCYARCALAAADAAAWRPIETAPKDGTEILGFDGSHIVVSWVDNSWWSDVGATFQPTHWQPLPKPPTRI